jgi:tRNA (guanine37-N1)-methyltransferase
MIQNEFRPNQRIADAFCGVGALCIRAAIAAGCSVVANDLNPDAAAYCRDSARRNGIDVSDGENSKTNGRFHVQCGDASQFIMNLGMDSTLISLSDDDDDDDELSPTTTTTSNLPDHLLLNFPLDSPHFLNALRWWPSSTDKHKSSSSSSPTSATTTTTRVHVYTFSRTDGERSASEVAIDMVANGLLPEGGYVEPSIFRGVYLNELGCNVRAREIRDASPGKMVICVSFSVTRLLLRRMQGDYGF